MDIQGFDRFETKMRSAGVSRESIAAFRHNYKTLLEGNTGMIPESSIQPVETLPFLNNLNINENAALLSQTVVIKLNGGLGTSMGLEGPKSLLKIKDKYTFLDLIARQILFLKKKFGSSLHFLLMNSFNTSEGTLEFLKKYPELGLPKDLELFQGQVPKVDAKTMAPVEWPKNPASEWCPPGHGDIYPSLLASGWLKRLMDAGVKYAFVSNADNLGASLDLRLLSWFAESKKSFIMEVAERTAVDKKGGHLAKRANGQFLLRESAQCPEADSAAFQDIAKHKFFNTNNLWFRLDVLEKILREHDGFVPLPLIRNSKTVDPRDKNSTPVLQLEVAMGAAIESFPDTGAVVVPRTRFAPVKTTSDLLALRSDAYEITEDWRLVLAPECGGEPPNLDLDSAHYKMVDQLEEKLKGAPSLKECRNLKLKGPVGLQSGVRFKGNCAVTAPGPQTSWVKPGEYADANIQL